MSSAATDCSSRKQAVENMWCRRQDARAKQLVLVQPVKAAVEHELCSDELQQQAASIARRLCHRQDALVQQRVLVQPVEAAVEHELRSDGLQQQRASGGRRLCHRQDARASSWRLSSL
jgi:hypothetical protein